MIGMHTIFLGTWIVVMHMGWGEKIYTSYQPLMLQSNTTNQCSSDDRSTWQGSTAKSQAFFQDIQTCTNQGAGSTDLSANVTHCLTNLNSDLSASCATCYGDSVDCGATNCRVPCQDTASSDCQSCLTPCTSNLSSCTGTVNLPSASTTSNTTKAAGGVTGLMLGSGMTGGVILWTIGAMHWMYT